MTDFTHHTPKLLSDADAAADLAGLPRPSMTEGLPSTVSNDPFVRDPLEVAIDNHVDGYTMEGDGNYHQPTEGERAMIKDAIMGLLADTEWDRLWGEHIESLVAARTAAVASERDALAVRVRELEAERDTPHLHNFSEAVTLEALHQRERWGSEHDAGKMPADWFWLVGYLAGKALHALTAGDTDKALHHTISTAAALANWHAAITGDHTAMRPGIDDAALSATTPPSAATEPSDAERLPPVPFDVARAAISLRENSYSGPLSWARKVIDWVVEQDAARATKGGKL